MIIHRCFIYGRPLTAVEQSIQACINQDIKRQPVIIDTDTDVDDLWAIHYILNVPTVDVLAITTAGNGYSSPFYSGSNALTFLDLIGCSNGVGVGYGVNDPLLSSGYVIPQSLLDSINSYMTAPTCLNQSSNIFLQPSPFGGIELIKLMLKYSKVPVDILALGPMTNIATAISEDRSIVSKIGTIYFSGGQFKPINLYPSLVPNKTVSHNPGSEENTEASPNVFLDVLALQRVGASGVKNMVAMPVTTQNALPINMTQLNDTLEKSNIQLKPFVFGFISSFAKCTSPTQGESFLKW
ncbi:unnamed protein product [Rotaria sp. Silwood1]|nr:unnamed protein product [Rotaria sp. Silwood1]